LGCTSCCMLREDSWNLMIGICSLILFFQSLASKSPFSSYLSMSVLIYLLGIVLVFICNHTCNALMTDLLFMDVKCLVSTDLSHYFMPFCSCSVLPKWPWIFKNYISVNLVYCLTLFYDVKRGKVVKVMYEINSVRTA